MIKYINNHLIKFTIWLLPIPCPKLKRTKNPGWDFRNKPKLKNRNKRKDQLNNRQTKRSKLKHQASFPSSLVSILSNGNNARTKVVPGQPPQPPMYIGGNLNYT